MIQQHTLRYPDVFYYFRKTLFYLYLINIIWAFNQHPTLSTNLTFLALIVHMLYFELDITGGSRFALRKTDSGEVSGGFLSSVMGTVFLRIFCCFAFTLSWTIAGLDCLLVFYMNPKIINQRAESEHFSLAMGWLGNIWLHWLPPIFISLDLYFNIDWLRYRLNLFPLIVSTNFIFRSFSKDSLLGKKNTTPVSTTPEIGDSRPLLNQYSVPQGYGEYHSTSAFAMRAEKSTTNTGKFSLSIVDIATYIWGLIATPGILLLWQSFFSMNKVYNITHPLSDLLITSVSISFHFITYCVWLYIIPSPIADDGRLQSRKDFLRDMVVGKPALHPKTPYVDETQKRISMVEDEEEEELVGSDGYDYLS